MNRNSSFKCTTCGGSSTQLLDGQRFCTTCGTQVTSFQEYDMDDSSVLKGALRLRAKKPKTTFEEELPTVDELDLKTPGRERKKGDMKRQALGVGSSGLDRMRNDTDMANDKVADHLLVVGRRLLTFTKMLAKVAETLTVECNFPSHFPESCFTLWQMYLKHCEVAFHDMEFEADLDNMYRAMIEKKFTAKEIQKSKAENTKKKQLDATLALNKSINPLELLVSEEIDEDLGLVTTQGDESAVPTKSEKVEICVIDTNINTRALHRASSMYLEPDVLVSIVYTAALATGCYWVTISDIVRWFNEDRFFLSTFEYNSMGAVKMKRHTESVFTASGIPLYEYNRVFLWLWQSIEPPILKIDLDMKVVFSRYLYDLNLPTDFIDCVRTLYKMFPMTTSITSKTVRLQGDIVEGFPICKAKKYSDVDKCFRKKLRNFAGNDVFFSNETKIMACILLALKLRFGLEDDGEKGSEEFNISLWIYQLKLRLLLLDGHCPTEILSTNLPFNRHNLEPPFGFGGNTITSMQRKNDSTQYIFKNKSRDRNFDNSCPSIKRIEQNNMLPPYFPPQFCRMSNRSETGNKVLFSPLRFQTNVLRDFMNQTRTLSEKEELNKTIDENCLELFNEDFGAYELPFEGDSTWERLFPKSHSFKRFPRPLWAQGCLYNYTTKKKNYLKGIDQKGFYGPCALFASKKACSDSYTAASPFMREPDSILYCCYMMIELLVIEQERHGKIVNDLVESCTIPLEYALFNREGVSTKYTGRISSYHTVGLPSDLKCYKLGYSENYEMDVNDDEDQYDYANCMNVLADSSSESEMDDKSQDSELDVSSSCESDSSSQGRCEYNLENAPRTEFDELLKRSSKRMMFSTRVYDWDTVWHILATKYW
ncbi:unnamed protein product [Auanema sp. JU1783]|nr:unnamed protein product [Auanema sp. JU1783]